MRTVLIIAPIAAAILSGLVLTSQAVTDLTMQSPLTLIVWENWIISI
jgi:hypothetical protein